MKSRPALCLALLLAATGAAAQNTEPARAAPANVRLTFHLIEADGFQGDDPEIRPIVTELRKLFRFQGYRLVSKSVLHAVADPPSAVSQQVTDDLGRPFIIRARVARDGEHLRLAVDLSYAGRGTLIDASVNLQNGKTVVLGSARPDKESGALILAVTPTIDP